jgi:3-hydroxyacyl-CoA dehydrogenase
VVLSSHGGKLDAGIQCNGFIMTKRISVIGAGTIGASWAAYFLARGFEVAAYDPATNGEDFARRFIDNTWPTLQKLNAVQSGADRKRFSFFRDPAEAAKGAAFVQESGPEREDVKIELFAAIDGAAPPDSVIASASSACSSAVSAGSATSERCVIGHPFNPPHPFRWSRSPAGRHRRTRDEAMNFYREIGKHPIHVRKEVRGHCQPAAGGVVARGDPSRHRGRRLGRRR